MELGRFSFCEFTIYDLRACAASWPTNRKSNKNRQIVNLVPRCGRASAIFTRWVEPEKAAGKFPDPGSSSAKSPVVQKPEFPAIVRRVWINDSGKFHPAQHVWNGEPPARRDLAGQSHFAFRSQLTGPGLTHDSVISREAKKNVRVGERCLQFRSQFGGLERKRGSRRRCAARPFQLPIRRQINFPARCEANPPLPPHRPPSPERELQRR